MAALAGTYSSGLFDSLPEVEDANGVFNSHNALSALKTSFQELFSRFNINPCLGIGLVHRHFSLAKGEILVDANGTSTAWRVPRNLANAEPPCYEKHEGYIKPRAWTVSNGQLIPYEFYFKHKSSEPTEFDFGDLSSLDPEFLREYIDLLFQHDLDGTLGLCILRKPLERQIEFSERTANITLPIAEVDSFDSEGTYIDTAWTYRGSPLELRVALSCVQQGKEHACPLFFLGNIRFQRRID